MKIYYSDINSPIGYIRLASQNNKLKSIEFLKEKNVAPKEWERNDQALSKVRAQLKEYFAGTRTHFNLDLDPDGTDFQKKVWQALAKIPYGKTVSYGHIAKQIGNAKASRAVGGANNKNPLPIVVPCHRVIGSSGKLVGYNGGISIKTQLLELEQALTIA